MKPLVYLSALAAAGALGAAVILACSNPAVSPEVPTPPAAPPLSEPAAPNPPEPTPPRGTLTLVYGTNNRIEITRGSRLAVRPTLTPRAAKVKYSTQGAPDWLNIHPDLGIISADAPRIQGAFSSADPSGVRQDFRFRILAAGIKGTYAKQSVTANLVLTVRSVSLPAVTYPARTVSRGGDAAARTISAAPTGGLTAAQADFAFDAATPPPPWLTLSDTGTIAGEVPANADTAAYKINVTGKGIYAGAADQAEFVLTVNSVPLPGMSYTAKTVSRAGDTAARTISVPLTSGLPASQADYAFEPPSSKPAWLSIGETGTISGTLPANPTVGSTTYTVKVTGKGIYAGETGNVTFTLNTVNPTPLPTMSYAAKTVNRYGNAAARTISVPLTNSLPATQAAYAFEPPSSKPAWLSIGETGTISGEVPTSATLGSAAYTVKVTGKGIYAGETGNVTFTLNVNGNDFDTLIAAGNRAPQGIWSDGTTMWVVDWDNAKIYAYSMSTKARDIAKDFNTLYAAGNRHPDGIWSDGTTMWVADFDSDKIYAYNMSTKERDIAKDFNTLYAAGNRTPQEIWSDGTTMWVGDYSSDKIYAYSMSTKERDIAKDFNTLYAAWNRNPVGLWSDGTTMWVVNQDSDKIYAYSMSTKERDIAKDFNTLIAAGNRHPEGIWSDGTTMWVADAISDKIYAYSVSTKERTP